MTFLPIVARELRVAARRRATFWTRILVATLAIASGTFLYLANIEAPPQNIGQRIFFGLMILAMFFCLFAGRQSTADCLSEEKRQGTLGLLFLTDLKGYDIVFGKLAATSLNGFYCLLAVFPVLAVPLLLGGITNGQFWRVILVLANTFLFSLSVGMFVSALSRDARRAMGANLLVLLAIIGIPGACAGLVAYFVPGQNFSQMLLVSCPPFTLYWSDDSRYVLQPSFYWWSVGVIHLLTWFLLGLAGWAVRRSWQDKPVRRETYSWNALWSWLKYGPRSKRAEFRRHLLDANAFYWLAARARFKPLHVWGVVLCIAVWWVWARFWMDIFALEERISGTNFTTAMMLNVALKLWIGLEASRPLAEERQSGSFELLLSTPLEIQDILKGQWLALKRQFFGPVLLSMVAVLFFLIHTLRHAMPGERVLVGIWVCGILIFAMDVLALFWVATFSALKTQSPNQAAFSSITRIVIAPALVFGAVAVLRNAYSYLGGTPQPGPGFYLVWWFGLGLVADLSYGLGARRHLLTNFRQLASHGPSKRAVESG
jgi:ABC-type Na+ efflux pump permease subunit